MGGEGCFSRRATMTWAVYAGHHAINGAYNLQGGATAAIIDYATACAGSVIFKWGAFVLTKANTIKYLRAAGPVPGVFKVIVELEDYDLDRGDMILHTTLTRDDIPPGERPFATAVTHMVDGPRRKRWKLRQKEQETTKQRDTGLSRGVTAMPAPETLPPNDTLGVPGPTADDASAVSRHTCRIDNADTREGAEKISRKSSEAVGLAPDVPAPGVEGSRL